MLNINRQGLQNVPGLWSDGAVRLETAMSEWYRNIESTLVTGASCNLSLWSNEFFLLAAVGSFAIAGNSEDELVIDVSFHRKSPSEMNVDFTAAVSRERGPPLAVIPARRIPLDSTGSISKVDLDTAIADARSFSYAQSSLIAQQLASMAERR